MIFSLMVPSGNEYSESKSNQIPQPLYTYLFRSSFLANVTPPNRQSFNLKSEFKSGNHISNS